MKRIFIISLILLLTGPGCAWFKTNTEKPADVLADDGMAAYKKGNYKDAMESFEKLKDWYPFSKYAVLAELKIADSRFYLKEYYEAAAMYEEFENLHPRNEAIPYVIYQIGRCFFEQIDSVDRDQTFAKKALDTFERLIKQFPQDEYVAQARAHIKKCHESLAGHEFYVGLYYFKSNHYKSALSRFEAVLKYPEAGELIKKAQDYIERCKKNQPPG